MGGVGAEWNGQKAQTSQAQKLGPTIAATSLLLASATLATGVGQAQEPEEPVEQAVLIPGATVFKRINPLYPIVATSYPVIGIHLRDPQVVKCAQNALDSDRAILDGVEQASRRARRSRGQGG